MNPARRRIGLVLAAVLASTALVACEADGAGPPSPSASVSASATASPTADCSTPTPTSTGATSPTPSPTVSPIASPTSAAPLAVTGLSVTPQASTPGQPVTVTLTVTGNMALQDLAAAVRDSRNLDNGDLDFPHFGAVTLNGPRTFTAQVTEPAPGTYRVHVAYQTDGTWKHIASPTAEFTISDVPPPTVAPPSNETGNPLGTVGARSNLAWNSGIWPPTRNGNIAGNFTQTLTYQEGRRGHKSDTDMFAQWNDDWGSLTRLDALRWLVGASDATPVLMLPPFPDGGTWTAAAAGSYDLYYRQIGAQIAAINPDRKTALRFAWEANGNWYGWSIVNTGGAGAFKTGWAKAVTAIRAGAGSQASNIVFDYSLSNLDDKGQGDPLTATYPGDAYVDVVGIDAYDHWQVTTSPTIPGKVASLDRLYTFAKSHGKWMSIDEWGLHHTGGSDPEGGDNPKYISAMYRWIKTHTDRLAWESYFQDDAQNNVNSSLFSPARDSNPNSRAAYLQEMR